MMAQDIIRRKRDGEPLGPDDIGTFVRGLTDGSISGEQVAAFAMAVWFRGMDRPETVALTLAMRDSGAVLDWSGIDRPIADKHSTGGVGDNVSLMLAPIAAACGLAVPMISGRGLGHTGGTLDKLQSIPGYTLQPDAALFRKTVIDAGCAIIGQTADLAPADRRLYAIRDVTATVDSVPLITASILSKKLAAGLQSLVLDIKLGSGAFMTSLEDATALARSLVDVANGAGVLTTGLITDMNEPLADAVGNALEIDNCIAFLRGEKAGSRLEAVVISFAAEMLMTSGLVSNLVEAQTRARAVLAGGQAADTFGRMVHLLGGPADFMERSRAYLAKAPVTLPVLAERAGYLSRVDALEIGMAVIKLGGGRWLASDTIDHRVGFDALLPLGTRVEKGDRIATVHASGDDQAEMASARLAALYTISEEAPAERAVILDRIT
ncbi:thymidine phosphorylase [Pararhizobium sp.]|uniref:thymidine phosphorylase n=1 Tax=Pararhizobium sp. TaxID=1977563 RepID=UPI00272801C6|nr:thymidine phosphorylase [Pararhizobium sp.]MDO9417846.1 thymidine phosphorylase [Pararhizobium sp.]